MQAFTDMYLNIDQTTSTKKKVQALVEFFKIADDHDKMWAIALFTHRRNKRTVKTSLLREWAAEMAGIPLWLFEESYHIVGDLAETIALVVPPNNNKADKSLTKWIHEIDALKNVEEKDKKDYILSAWQSLDQNQRFLFNKLITGGFRIGVSRKSITKAVAQYTGTDENIIAHRLMGNWHADDVTFDELLIQSNAEDDLSRPYPFYLAYALENEPSEMGDIKEWYAEWKWDGIRGQIIKRNNQLYIWSRGEELVTDKFPELKVLENIDEDNWVIDGEIIGIKDGVPLDFHQLQTRLNRKNVSKKHLQDIPISIIAYDILEYDGEDIREKNIEERRSLLEKTVKNIDSEKLLLSPIIEATTWDDLINIRKESRDKKTEGLMLKRKNSPYKSGRKKGDWWKWKVDPMTIDAVMIYAQRGHGRRANLYSDFTFAVWDGDRLVPFAKAYSGLTDIEFKEITKFVKTNAIERFGPVTSVKPELVFELAFEGIANSKRHKSGIAVRFPRIKRWRKDKPAAEANTLNDLKLFLNNS